MKPTNHEELYWRPISEAEEYKKPGVEILGIDEDGKMHVYWWAPKAKCFFRTGLPIAPPELLIKWYQPTNFMPAPKFYEEKVKE